jgi:hypothetical protein
VSVFSRSIIVYYESFSFLKKESLFFKKRKQKKNYKKAENHFYQKWGRFKDVPDCVVRSERGPTQGVVGCLFSVFRMLK